MIERLERAVAAVSQLPADAQEHFAQLIFEELDDERRWSEAFAESQDALANMARKALDEYRTGQTQELDPDTLE